MLLGGDDRDTHGYVDMLQIVLRMTGQGSVVSPAACSRLLLFAAVGLRRHQNTEYMVAGVAQ
jgi:hypothetical protein